MTTTPQRRDSLTQAAPGNYGYEKLVTRPGDLGHVRMLQLLRTARIRANLTTDGSASVPDARSQQQQQRTLPIAALANPEELTARLTMHPLPQRHGTDTPDRASADGNLSETGSRASGTAGKRASLFDHLSKRDEAAAAAAKDRKSALKSTPLLVPPLSSGSAATIGVVSAGSGDARKSVSIAPPPIMRDGFATAPLGSSTRRNFNPEAPASSVTGSLERILPVDLGDAYFDDPVAAKAAKAGRNLDNTRIMMAPVTPRTIAAARKLAHTAQLPPPPSLRPETSASTSSPRPTTVLYDEATQDAMRKRTAQVQKKAARSPMELLEAIIAMWSSGHVKAKPRRQSYLPLAPSEPPGRHAPARPFLRSSSPDKRATGRLPSAKLPPVAKKEPAVENVTATQSPPAGRLRSILSPSRRANSPKPPTETVASLRSSLQSPFPEQRKPDGPASQGQSRRTSSRVSSAAAAVAVSVAAGASTAQQQTRRTTAPPPPKLSTPAPRDSWESLGSMASVCPVRPSSGARMASPPSRHTTLARSDDAGPVLAIETASSSRANSPPSFRPLTAPDLISLAIPLRPSSGLDAPEFRVAPPSPIVSNILHPFSEPASPKSRKSTPPTSASPSSAKGRRPQQKSAKTRTLGATLMLRKSLTGSSRNPSHEYGSSVAPSPHLSRAPSMMGDLTGSVTAATGATPPGSASLAGRGTETITGLSPMLSPPLASRQPSTKPATTHHAASEYLVLPSRAIHLVGQASMYARHRRRRRVRYLLADLATPTHKRQLAAVQVLATRLRALGATDDAVDVTAKLTRALVPPDDIVKPAVELDPRKRRAAALLAAAAVAGGNRSAAASAGAGMPGTNGTSSAPFMLKPPGLPAVRPRSSSSADSMYPRRHGPYGRVKPRVASVWNRRETRVLRNARHTVPLSARRKMSYHMAVARLAALRRAGGTDIAALPVSPADLLHGGSFRARLESAARRAEEDLIKEAEGSARLHRRREGDDDEEFEDVNFSPLGTPIRRRTPSPVRRRTVHLGEAAIAASTEGKRSARARTQSLKVNIARASVDDMQHRVSVSPGQSPLRTPDVWRPSDMRAMSWM
ncbi:hypothetical protein BC828DRAFT_372327 [Blastocladiella britannica]|nr:hypothetical protein BC828DRAFT_372327 [Blastocladiella britannica]